MPPGPPPASRLPPPPTQSVGQLPPPPHAISVLQPAGPGHPAQHTARRRTTRARPSQPAPGCRRACPAAAHPQIISEPSADAAPVLDGSAVAATVAAAAEARHGRESSGRRDRRTFPSRSCTRSRRSPQLSSPLSQVHINAELLQCLTPTAGDHLPQAATRSTMCSITLLPPCLLVSRNSAPNSACGNGVQSGRQSPSRAGARVIAGASEEGAACGAAGAPQSAGHRRRSRTGQQQQQQEQQPAAQPADVQAQAPADAAAEATVPVIAANGSASTTAPGVGAVPCTRLTGLRSRRIRQLLASCARLFSQDC